MKYRNRNKVVITFNSGDKIESTGTSSSVEGFDLVEDLNWIGIILNGQIRDSEHSITDVKTIEIKIDQSIND